MQTQVQAPYSASKTGHQSSDSISPSTGFYTYLHILRKRFWLLAVSASIALLIGFIVNLVQRPLYQAATEIVLTSKNSSASDSNQSVTTFIQDPTFMLTQSRLVKSAQFTERVLSKLENLEDRQLLLKCFLIPSQHIREGAAIYSTQERLALTGAIGGALAISEVAPGARILNLSVSGYNAAAVARIADAASQAFVEISYESQIASLKQSFMLISSSLAEVREKIKTGELAAQKVSSEIKLLEALKIYGDKHPDVVLLRKEIISLAKTLIQGLKNLQAMQFSQRKDLVSLIMEPHVEIPELSAVENDLNTLKPILELEINTNREMYNSIFKRLQEVEVSDTDGSWFEAKVIESARIPGRPAKPNKQLNLIIALILGLFSGVGIIFFLEYLDSSIKSIDDIRNYLRLFPLGIVPIVELDGSMAKKRIDTNQVHDGAPYWLISDSDIPFQILESYRMIRTNLAFGGAVDTSLKVLQVTSAVKGEGKTTTVANLGISLSQAGIKTLIVDADMRRPCIHKIFGLPKTETGFSNALAGKESWESLVQPTQVPNLFCISAGPIPPNPAELLSSKKLKALMEEMSLKFDMVLFDSPPMISVADGSLIASAVAGTILVSRAGFIPRHLCHQAKNIIESVNGKIIGSILNSVEERHHPYNYHSYYKYSSYYGEEKASKRNGAKQPSDASDLMGKIKLLKEPLIASFSNSMDQFLRVLKGKTDKKGSKFFDDKP